MKPKLFVGSSVEGISVAYAVQLNLQYQAEVTVWDQGVFNLSSSALDSLIQVLDHSDFGAFIFTPDDIVNMRGEENRAVRDNVLFELGLFVGRLGKGRSFILVPRDQKDLHLPTDLIGMMPGTYETDRTDRSFQAATGPACHQIREAIKQLGPLSKGSGLPQTPQLSDQNLEVRNRVEEKAKTESADSEQEIAEDEPDWLDIFISEKYDETISLLEQKIESSEEESEKLFFKSWIGRAIAKKDLRSGIEYLNKLRDENPESDDPYLGIAYAYNSNDLLDEALETLEVGLSVAGDKEWLYLQKALILDKDGRVDDALTIFNQLMKEFPQYVSGYLNAATFLTEQGKNEEAKAVYEAGLKALPMDESILYAYGRLLIDMKDNEAALTVFRKLNRLNSEKSEYQSYLGNIYLDMGFNGLALEAYQKANELAEEKESWIISNIGNIFNNRGFYPQAIQSLKKAIELDADSAYAHERLSSAIKHDEEERKKADEIVRKFKQSTRQEPKSVIEDTTAA